MMPNTTLYGTLSVLEAIWLLFNISGCLYSIANALDARLDYLALKIFDKATGQATRQDWVIVWQRARHAIIGAGIEVMFVIFSVVAAFTPNVPEITWPAFVLSLVLLGGSAALSVGAWLDSKARRMLRGGGK